MDGVAIAALKRDLPGNHELCGRKIFGRCILRQEIPACTSDAIGQRRCGRARSETEHNTCFRYERRPLDGLSFCEHLRTCSTLRTHAPDMPAINVVLI